ncbi:hypothetical protein N7528_004164 [Penicillium herquei]|nr:hypothetical protein N7528_004164 [Penicillium herquei]
MTVQILDGGLGTSLQDKYGVKFDSKTTPLWSSDLLVTDTVTLEACQKDFIDSGADVLLTATYQVSPEGFQRTKTATHPDGIPVSAISSYIQTAVDVAERATAGRSAKIALSLGPYGACMVPGQEYSGAYDEAHDSEEALYQWHLERLRLVLSAEGDLVSRLKYIAFETLPRLDEVRAVRRAIKEARIESVPFWIACVFPREDECLPDGSSVEQVVDAAILPMESGLAPWGIGMNCTKVHKLSGLVDRFGACVEKVLASGTVQTVPSLILYPDGTNGEVYNTTTQTWEKPEGTADQKDTRPWETQLAQVVNDARLKGPFTSFLVGGCCKATHSDIGKLRDQF